MEHSEVDVSGAEAPRVGEARLLGLNGRLELRDGENLGRDDERRAARAETAIIARVARCILIRASRQLAQFSGDGGNVVSCGHKGRQLPGDR